LRRIRQFLPLAACLLFVTLGVVSLAQNAPSPSQPTVPPRVLAARRFLAQRGVAPGRRPPARFRLRANTAPRPQSAAPSPAWEPLGPAAVLTPSFGLVTGRITSLALDPTDPTGNTLYIGASGGGVWVTTNAAASDPTKIAFRPLTDRMAAMNTMEDASISIGALTVQPGGTGVILAGTGDPNDALDSYYGAGVLLSGDNGNSWTLIQGTSDVSAGLGAINYGFVGEGFAGFAWGTSNPQFVVAAVSQSYESSLVDGDLAGYSYAGLYYSDDAGASWHLATITDGNGNDVQGPNDLFAGAEGNAATAVVWNPVRNVFVAAVRFHGYYQSADGVTWTRMPSQPGPGLSTAMCPTNAGQTGSPACPIFRGALAVNPLTGDTFAWTVDENNQDQGIWQDTCAVNKGSCGSPGLNFSTRVATTALETSTTRGAVTILNGDYNLVLSAVPSDKDTLLLAGANDLWKCSLAAGCTWRNTTNSTTCMSAGVGEYQHALVWNPANPLEILAGNDSGLWRSEDGIAEPGPVCSSSDADHWQNLNGGLGSLAEIESMSQVGASPYTLLAGMGANGTAGVKSTTGPSAQWPQILSGEGGPVAIDPVHPDNWYVNSGAGVSIHLCTSSSPCTPATFGKIPVVSNADVANDGLTMTVPAPFLVDPADSNQLLVATCRLWRGPAKANTWTSANAVTPLLGSGSSGSYCSGNPLIRTLAAIALPGGGEVVYAGTYGAANGGSTLGGHVLKTILSAGGTWSGWTDLTLNPVTDDSLQFNVYGLDVSSIVIDSHDTTGNTLYVTIAGIPDRFLNIRLVYRSTDGGAHWKDMTSNLQDAPANSLAVDPVDASTLYLATDVGVFATQKAPTCGDSGVKCWFAYGAGLPESPVTALSAAPTTTSPNVLVAGTYGRGIWQVPLLTAGVQMTSATANPTALSFDDQGQGTTSDAQSVTLTNNGAIALLPTAVNITGDFARTENCVGASIDTGASCTIEVTFSPTRLGSRTGQLTIQGNIGGGNITVALSGNGVPPPQITLQPTSIAFGDVETGTTSPAEQVTVENAGGSAAAITSVTVSGPFVLASNSCGTKSLAANTDCQMTVQFAPAVNGAATGVLTMVDSAGTQTVQLTGNGTAPPTDTLSATSLTFPGTTIGVSSAAQIVTITNSGGNALTSIAVSAAGPFQQTGNCTTQLTAGASCAISVTYVPTAAGAQTGTLTVADILKTQTVTLAGTGLNPPNSFVSPSRVTFPTTGVGVDSAPIAVTLTNTGFPSSLDNLVLTVSSGFRIATNTCGSSLAVGASCAANLVFTPTAMGPASGALTIASSFFATNFTVPLSGTGFDFAAAITGASSQTVASGQTASYSVTLTPAGGQPGTFSFQCNSLPQYAACVFNPSSLSVAANSTGSETMQITTTESSAALARPAWRSAALPLSLACGLLLIPLATRKRRLFAVVLLALCLSAFSACSGAGGGGGATPPPTGAHTTAPGTYPITLAVTSSGLQHNVKVTLIVD
jgi:hypothetical protein